MLPARFGVSGPMHKEMSPLLDIIEQEAEKDHQPFKIISIPGTPVPRREVRTR